MLSLFLTYALTIETPRYRRQRKAAPRQRGPRFGTCTYGITLPLGYNF